MTLPRESDAVHAAGIEEIAAQWLERRDGEGWSEADQAEFDAWLAAAPAHAVAYWRLEGAWNSADRLPVLGAAESEWLAPGRRKGPWPALIGLAAGLAVVAAVGVAALQYVLQPRERSYFTDVGGRELVTFADGTEIELNTNTAMRMTTRERTIWLDRGEAYFQVKHDPAHPFVVIAGNNRITDLGTKFVVRRDDSRLKVALLEGRVRFGAPARSKLLMPGDEVVATANSFSVSRQSARNLTDTLGWRQGVLVFRYTALADAVRELNRYNQKKLVVPDPSVGQLKIYGTFQLRDVEVFARAVRDALGLHVSDEGNEIVIAR